MDEEKYIASKLIESIDSQECIQYISEVTTDIRIYNAYKDTLALLRASPLREMQAHPPEADSINDYLFEHQIMVFWKTDATNITAFTEEKARLLSKILEKVSNLLFDFNDNSWSLFFKIYIPRKPND